MSLNDFIDELIPGDPDRGAPPFSLAVGARLQQHYSALCADMTQALAAPEISAAATLDVRVAALLARDAVGFAVFRDTVLGLYFSTPIVLAALGESSEPLFPRGQSLPAIDFDLLNPVYERGRCWRATQEREA